MQHPTSQHLELVLDHNNFKWFSATMTISYPKTQHNNEISLCFRICSLFDTLVSQMCLLPSVKQLFSSCSFTSCFLGIFQYQIVSNGHTLHASLSTICTAASQSLIGLLFHRASERLEQRTVFEATCKSKVSSTWEWVDECLKRLYLDLTAVKMHSHERRENGGETCFAYSSKKYSIICLIPQIYLLGKHFILMF